MKAKKPVLIAVLILALLAVALIVPAVASGKNDNKPTAWANWARAGKYMGVSASLKDCTGGYMWIPVDYPWQAALAVHAQLADDAVGHEVMNWQSAIDPPTTPPWKQNRTTDLVDCSFADLGDGSYRARLLFRYNTEELGWPDPPYGGDVYHLWVLTDNPGNEMDHVELYSKLLPPSEAPEIGDDPGLWGGECSDPPLGAGRVLDLDCRGVQVVVK